MKVCLKEIMHKIIKYPITIWMLISVLTFCAVTIGYSAYSGTIDVKRVVSTQASSSTVFSSNYMESGDTLIVKNLHTIAEGNFICNVTVCNYDQLDQSSPARSLITYNFTAELVKYNKTTEQYEKVTETQLNDGNQPKTFYVQKKMDNNEIINTDTQHDLNTGSFEYTYTGETLTGGETYKDSFDICFDSVEVEKDIPELFIRVTAVPNDESVQLNSGVPTLSSIISISKGRTVETGWHGSLNESNINDYDGYNLVIEGSGSGTIDILWDNNEFTINPAFLTINSNKLTAITDDVSEGWKKTTLTVNSTEENRYVVQFYKKKQNVSYTGNEFPSKYIICNNYIATPVEVVP
ncbi:MAG: hypothetical protein VZR53_08460 [Prevotella sp.]|nr:hypothetical protein [Prevotella sp.]